LIRRKLLQADARNDVYAVCEALHMHFDRTLRSTNEILEKQFDAAAQAAEQSLIPAL
jgi:hypothetical protein